MDSIPQLGFVIVIGKIVSPENIIFISRISNNRFCNFLSSKQILDNLMEKHRAITLITKSYKSEDPATQQKEQ